jgi:ribose transport system substrate-binding protein
VKDRSLVTMLSLALFAALVAALAFRGEAEPNRAKEKVIAIFKTSGTANAFWVSVRDGVMSGAEDYGFDVSIRAPRDEIYVDEQIEIMRGAIAERPAAILLAAGDYQRLVASVKAAKAAGIKVVCVDSFIASDDADAKVGTDNYEAGQKCGWALLRYLGSAPQSRSNAGRAPRVAVMSYVQGSSTAIGRESGLRNALGDRVVVIGTSYSSSESERAYAQAKALLEGEPDLAGIAALNLPTLLGAARALAESGRKGEVALVGVDGSAEVIKHIEGGVIRDAIVQKPFNMGYLSMATARELLSNKRPSLYTNTGSVDIDKTNMFKPENQKLLFPVDGR